MSPPSTPTGLSATAVSASRVDLAWNASTDDVGVTRYEIFRDTETEPVFDDPLLDVAHPLPRSEQGHR